MEATEAKDRDRHAIKVRCTLTATLQPQEFQSRPPVLFHDSLVLEEGEVNGTFVQRRD
jgi:hypothetical protein